MEWGRQVDPVMPVGKYRGIAISKLPLSYCRWILMQDFAPDVIEAAHNKVRKSAYSKLDLHVSRHALDMFSTRFLDHWDNAKGMATFLAEYAEQAWREGEDVSKHRHEKDGTIKSLNDICFVFGLSPHIEGYKELVTIYLDPRAARLMKVNNPQVDG